MSSPGRAAALAHALAFFSGLAALVYEVTWTRRLTFVFGASIRAVSAVLAAYMAGLALGSIVAGRRAEGVKRPLRAYAWIEAGVGVAGLFVPALVARLRAADTLLYDGGAASGALTALRFVLAFVVVGLPAALMGATFPLLVRGALGDRPTVGAHVATLYAVNTAGAVAGTIFAGFYAIGALGVTGTERFAAAVNVAVALCALAWSARSDRPAQAPSDDAPPESDEALEAQRESDNDHEPEAPPERALPLRALAATATLTGAACIACEVLWSRALAFTFSWLNNTTYTFPAMLGVVLAGVGLGSAGIAPFLARTKRPTWLYGALVALAGASVAVSAAVMSKRGSAPFGPALDVAHQLVVRRALANVIAEAATVVALPAVLFGAAFPAAVRAATGRSAGASAAAATLYAASTAGAIAGSILAAFVIVPLVGIVRGVVAIGAVVALTGLAVMARAEGLRRGSSWAVAALALGSIAAVHWRLPARALLSADGAPVVFYEEGPTATVSVARAQDGFLRIDVDGVPVAGTSPTMLTDQKSLAHVPMMLVRDPRSALTVGFGSGGTSHSYLLHPRLHRVRAVEIAPEVLHGAPYLTASNHGVLSRGDPRYGVVLDDARSYLAHTRARYDIIATDCTDLRYRSNANLYDLEYFQHTRARLEPGGVVAVWLPLGGLSREMFKVSLRTFGEVFRDFVVFWPNGFPSHYVVLVGWRDGLHLSWERLVERVSSRPVRDDLREISLEDPVKILSTVLADGRSLRAALRDAPINTEDRPVLEFLAPLSGYSPRATVDNLEFLLDHRASPGSLVEGAMPADARARLARMESAMPTVVAAHGASFSGETLRAARLYLDALEIAPDDVAVRDRARELARDLGPRVNEPWVALTLCRAEQLAGDRARALPCYDALARSRVMDDEELAGTLTRWRASAAR